MANLQLSFELKNFFFFLGIFFLKKLQIPSLAILRAITSTLYKSDMNIPYGQKMPGFRFI